jgi:hypothetical protein
MAGSIRGNVRRFGLLFWGLRAGVGLAVAAVVLACAAGGAARAAAASGPVVIPPQQQNYGQLGALWWKWALSIPDAQFPLTDPTGADCAVGQNGGGTWFLAGTFGGEPVTRSCTVPARRTLFFPLINVYNDLCPPPSPQPAPGQSLKDFLTQGAVSVINQASNLQASLDGANIPILPSYRGTSNMFSFTGDPSLKVLDPCITGSPQPAVSDGYWLLLAPLSPGQHTLRFSGSLGSGTPFFTTTATYNLTVQ